MKNDRYDTIVVGGGIAGLGVGAILAKELNQKVLLLDLYPEPGGRLSQFSYPNKDWRVDIGLHLVELGDLAPCSELNRRVGKTVNWGPPCADTEIWNGEKIVNIASLVQMSKESKKLFANILMQIATMSMPDIEAWDNRSLEEWLLESVPDPSARELFAIMGMIMTTIPDPGEMAAGEVLYIAKQNLTLARQLVNASYPIEGMKGITRGLAEAIVENGGEIRSNCDVQEILIEKKKAIGVRIPAKDYVYPEGYRVAQTEAILADRVVCAIPIYKLPRVIDFDPITSPLPEWWLRQINDIKNEVTGGCGFTIGLSEPVIDPEKKCFVSSLKLKHAGLAFQAFASSNFSNLVAPPGKQILYTGTVLEHPEASSKFKRERYLPLIWKDLCEMFPGIEKKIEWCFPSYVDACDGLARKPGLVGKYKPALKAPGIENLFFAGDTYRGRGLGLNAAANSSLMCADLIIKELKK